MEYIGERHIWYYIPHTSIEIPLGGLNVLTVLNTLFVMAFLWLLLGLLAWRLTRVPGRSQFMLEQYVQVFDRLVTSSLELETRKKNRRFFPLISSLFLFLLLSNFIGIIPGAVFEEPTADINCTLALGFLGISIATYCGVRSKGAWGYFEELLGPLWSDRDAKGMEFVANKASALFFFPLSVIGEMAKVVSISFRLFGNIIGGSVIITVVSTLVFNTVIPLGLSFFFVFFVGTVQAFVFTMLTLTYIAVAIK